jgi:hypothetical protein
MMALRPGASAFRIGPRYNAPLRCIVIRIMKGGFVEVRASTFSRNSSLVRAEDVFADREACRAEINRRAEQSEASGG